MKWIAIIFAGLMVVMVVVGITIQDCGSASTVSAPEPAKSLEVAPPFGE